jgi:tripartite-type tricarboxylate transporter receptor subunit TctC
MNEIPYNGTTQSKTALFGGHIDFAAITVSELREPGKEAVPLKVIAQMADRRSPALPGVPTAVEQGFNDVMPAERGFAVPKGTPPSVGVRLQAAIEATMKDPEYLQRAGEDASALAYLPGVAWTKAIADRADVMRKLAAAMPKE